MNKGVSWRRLMKWEVEKRKLLPKLRITKDGIKKGVRKIVYIIPKPL